MYRRLTIAQLKKVCDERSIDCACFHYKREFIEALMSYDNDYDRIEVDDDDSCVRYELNVNNNQVLDVNNDCDNDDV